MLEIRLLVNLIIELMEISTLSLLFKYGLEKLPLSKSRLSLIEFNVHLTLLAPKSILRNVDFNYCRCILMASLKIISSFLGVRSFLSIFSIPNELLAIGIAKLTILFSVFLSCKIFK